MVSLPTSTDSCSNSRSVPSNYNCYRTPDDCDHSPRSTIPTQCNCGERIRIQTAMTLENGGRRFVSCPKRKECNCGFFEWVDPLFPYQARKVIKELLVVKKDLEKTTQILETTVNETEMTMERLTEELLEAKGVVAYLSHIDDEQQQELQNANAKEKALLMRLKWPKFVILFCIVFISSAIMLLK